MTGSAQTEPGIEVSRTPKWQIFFFFLYPSSERSGQMRPKCCAAPGRQGQGQALYFPDDVNLNLLQHLLGAAENNSPFIGDENFCAFPRGDEIDRQPKSRSCMKAFLNRCLAYLLFNSPHGYPLNPHQSNLSWLHFKNSPLSYLRPELNLANALSIHRPSLFF